MEEVIIYGRSGCGFCSAARQLCELRKLPYRYVDMPAEGITKEDLSKKIGRAVRTVPQIFVGEQHVGGFDEFSEFVSVRDREGVS